MLNKPQKDKQATDKAGHPGHRQGRPPRPTRPKNYRFGLVRLQPSTYCYCYMADSHQALNLLPEKKDKKNLSLARNCPYICTIKGCIAPRVASQSGAALNANPWGATARGPPQDQKSCSSSHMHATALPPACSSASATGRGSART